MIGARIDVVGRLTKDIELKAAKSGTMIARGSLAYNLYEGEVKGKTSHFIDFVAFAKRAETMFNFLKKGHQVRLIGTLVHQRWETTEGKKMSKHEIRVEDLEFLEKKKDSHGPPDDHYEEMAPAPKEGQPEPAQPGEVPPMGVLRDDAEISTPM